MKTHLSIVLPPPLLLAAILSLTACGGGGSSVVPSSALNDSRADIAGETTVTAIQGVASGSPAFGSVTQSSNTDGSLVTTDHARVSLVNDQARVTISGGGRTPLVLDTARDTVISESRDSPLGSDYSYKGEAVVKETPGSLTLAAVYTNWNNDDPNDYLAGGYWIYGDRGQLGFSHVEAGAFVDGPEIRSNPTLPQSGTATYRGDAGGLYVHENTSTPLVEFGDFGTDIRLTANFDTATISGCMGCVSGAELSGIAMDTSTGEWETFSVNTPTQINLGSIGFNSDGTFHGSAMTLSDSRMSSHVTVTNKGSWGGKFSNIPDADGIPRLAAGTIGVEYTISGDPDWNGRGKIVGAWFATQAP